MLAALADLVADATPAFEAYDYARALEHTERFFWSFCDDYVELVKQRAYGAGGDAASASACAALGLALDTLLRLFAPHLPFVTEEVWSWWREGRCIRHRGRMRPRSVAPPADGHPEVYTVAAAVLGEVRKAKTAGEGLTPD